MKVLVLNCGSSSIKYKLFDMTSGDVMAQGGIEKIGLPDAFLKLTDKEGKKVILEKEIPGHQEGIEFILSVLTDATYGCIQDYKEIDAVGHRVVHGGEKFASSVLLTKEVLDKVVECTDLAPSPASSSCSLANVSISVWVFSLMFCHLLLSASICCSWSCSGKSQKLWSSLRNSSINSAK